MATLDCPDWQHAIVAVTGVTVTDCPDWQEQVTAPGGGTPINLANYVTTAGISLKDTSTHGVTFNEASTGGLMRMEGSGGTAITDTSTFGITIESINAAGNVSVSSTNAVAIGGTNQVSLSTNAGEITMSSGGGSIWIAADIGDKISFNDVTPVAKPTVTGSKGGNAALASLLTALSSLGLVTDSST